MTPMALLDLLKISGRIISAYPRLSGAPKLDRKQMEAKQWALLQQRFQDASSLPMYRALGYSEPKSIADWEKLPLLKKSHLLSRPLEDRLNPKYKIEDLILSKSSGSTGQALDVYYDRDSFYFFVLAGLRLYRMAFPYAPWHRQTYIYTIRTEKCECGSEFRILEKLE